jgi:DNA-binding LytR/AlgR family response regulator
LKRDTETILKIVIEEILNISETEIVIKCRRRDDYVDSIITSLRLFERKITGKKEGSSFILTAADVYYFESVDDKVFCCAEKEVYETSFKLYEIETTFKGSPFLRVNKSMILNITKIREFKSLLNGRMEAVLDNEERVEISRNYVPALKVMLGGRAK